MYGMYVFDEGRLDEAEEEFCNQFGWPPDREDEEIQLSLEDQQREADLAWIRKVQP